MKKHTDYVTTEKWFAWHPVKCDGEKWVWFKTVYRTIDERPLVYLGLLPITSYSLTNTIHLEDEDLKMIYDAVDNPPEPNENLKNAAKRYKKLKNK